MAGWEIDANDAFRVAADFTRGGIEGATKAMGITRHFGQLISAQVKANASGRPGPRVQTGDYRRSINSRSTRSVASVGEVSAEIGTNKPQGRRLEFGFHGTDSLGRHFCVDEETEIFTTDGWSTQDALVEGTRVMTLNPESWMMEWQPASAVHRFPGPHALIGLEARTLSMLTTPDHRWLVERFYPRRSTWLREWRTTETMTAAVRVPLVQKNADLPAFKTVDDDVVELLAWFWTEGSFDWSRQAGGEGRRVATPRPVGLRISQSQTVNPEKTDRIRRLLTRMFGEAGRFADGAHWNERQSPQTGVVLFHLDRVACWLLEGSTERPSKAMRPDFLLTLTQDQLDLLVEVSFLADGHVDRSGVAKLGQADEARIRSWEFACVLAGRPIVTRATTGHERKWVTTLLRSSSSSAFNSALRGDRDHARITPVMHEGLVWCPSTENGTWLARRRGKIYFTGNSQAPLPHFGPALDKYSDSYAEAIGMIVDDV